MYVTNLFCNKLFLLFASTVRFYNDFVLISRALIELAINGNLNT
jgi:hypothetical protein